MQNIAWIYFDIKNKKSSFCIKYTKILAKILFGEDLYFIVFLSLFYSLVQALVLLR